MRKSSIVASILLLCASMMCKAGKPSVKKSLDYCAAKISSTLNEMKNSDGCIDYTKAPWHILQGEKKWDLSLESEGNWVSGFWAGLLWYDYYYTHDAAVKSHAMKFLEGLESISRKRADNHDLGFLIFCSYGNAYKLTHRTDYKEVILRTADTLATLFNPKVGTILSWPASRKPMGWPHNTIVDNMMNLEMLFWASKNGGGKRLYDIAVKHATTTMQHHFRPDGSCYHVAVYDTIDGHFIKGVTRQGYSDASMWARGQSWAIYGYTMTYRMTRDQKFLAFAQKVADVFLRRLPADKVPYWDFDDPSIPQSPRDASAAAISSSALLELSTYLPNAKGKYYRQMAEKILASLSKSYQSHNTNSAILLHSVGNKPGNGEVDASLIYADYYYMEGLLRLRALQQHQPLPMIGR
jgi:unsaturated chondroitin disaccharide hydrolase